MNDVSGARAAANQHHRSDPQSPQAAMISSSTLILVMLPFLIGVMTPTADGFPTNYCIISSYYLFTHQQKQQYHPSCATKLMLSPPRSISLSQSPTRTISSRNIIGMVERRGTSTVSEMEAESNILREEIKELKKEALRRLEELSEQLTSTTTTTILTTATTSSPDTIPMATIAVKKTEVVDNLTLLPPPTPILFTSTTKDELDDLSTSSSLSNKEGEKKKKSTKVAIVALPTYWMALDGRYHLVSVESQGHGCRPLGARVDHASTSPSLWTLHPPNCMIEMTSYVGVMPDARYCMW